ncbi:MAG: MAPEG family protein [Pseudomonadota bacterium]
MPVEVTILGYAALLQVGQFLIMALAVNWQLGPKYTAGPRDLPKDITGRAGRLFRAFNNHFEALIFFTIAVVVVTLGQAGNAQTELCAWLYLCARILYVPAYAFHVPFLRSSLWGMGFIATVSMLVIALW